MRIIGGIRRGAKLVECKSLSVRPTGQRVREAIFNLLDGGRFTPIVKNATILDLFAGTGALGLEAISRGANEAYFIERDQQAIKTLRANIQKLGFIDTTTVLAGSLENITRWAYPPADVVFCDAPYTNNITSQTIQNIARIGAIRQGALVIIEMPKKDELTLPYEFKFADKRIYGISSIYLFNWKPF